MIDYRSAVVASSFIYFLYRMSAKKAKTMGEASEITGENVVEIQKHSSVGAHVEGYDAYLKQYAESIKNPNKFWETQAKKNLLWDKEFDTVMSGSFVNGDVQYFGGGKLNASVQCLDRHVFNKDTADKTCIIYEGDEVGSGRKYTYREALAETCRLANLLKSMGVKKGDAVTIFLPMIPEIVFAMLACARIGAPHSVVFAGFSAEALRDRIVDCDSKYVFTADEAVRGGKAIGLKKLVDDALNAIPNHVKTVFLYKRTGVETVNFVPGRDLWVKDEIAKQRPYCPPESVDAEDTLFYLYTSGSTGKPKGVAHTTAGYLLYASMTHKNVFDVRKDDVYACVADCGWITGHTYIVYGPLCNGSSTMIFESTPMYPDVSRYWDLVQRHKITQFYTAPTAIRALMKYGVEPIQKHDLSSLRVLGTVGEPIGPVPWKWYHENVGQSRCAVVDTFWQTETGGIVMTPLPGATPLKPGSCCLPFFGIEPALLEAQSGKEIPFVKGEETSGVLCFKAPWPSMTRTVRGDHERYMKTYFSQYPGYYFTGDGATRDKDGYYWITGRVDDVLNVSGHRIGSAELESAVNKHAKVAESACIGYPHEIKGEGIAMYVILKEGQVESPELVAQLRMEVRNHVGAFATPDLIIISPNLPKTRSGKIMRRILRKIVAMEHDSLGDISTLADPSIVELLIAKVKTVFETQAKKA